MMRHVWLGLILFIALMFLMSACSGLSATSETGSIPAGINEARKAAVEQYMEAQGTEEMFCFNVPKFTKDNSFITYGEQCYIHCLGLPKSKTKVNVEGTVHEVTKYSHFCKAVDRVIRTKMGERHGSGLPTVR